jgi:hypothetical protein
LRFFPHSNSESENNKEASYVKRGRRSTQYALRLTPESKKTENPGTLSLSENSTSERTVGGASRNWVTSEGEVGEFFAIRANSRGEVGEVSARLGRAASFQTSSATHILGSSPLRNPGSIPMFWFDAYLTITHFAPLPEGVK